MATYSEVIYCKNCKYFSEFEDIDKPEYRECKYFSNWSTAYYMLPNDFCSCAKYKEEKNEVD